MARVLIATLAAIHTAAFNAGVRGVPWLCGRALYRAMRWRHRHLLVGVSAEPRARYERFLDSRHGHQDDHAARQEPSSSSARRVRIAGLTWCIPHDDRKPGSLSDRLIRGELPLADILRTRRYAKGGVMIDIGANIGTTAIPRVLLGDVDCVYGVEPNPANHACLQRTIADNGLQGYVMIDRVALGSTDGEAELLVASRLGRHRLMPQGTAKGATIRVPTLRLDTWAATLGPDLDRVRYVKCDTQGWESHVLAGAPETLSRRSIVWEMEICPALLEAGGSSLDDLCTTITRHFRWFVDLRDHGGRLDPRPTSELTATVRAAVTGSKNYTNVILGP